MLIKEINKNEIAECVNVIKESFLTVADQFNITPENAPRFTAFSISEDKLYWQFTNENQPMFGCYENNKMIGYYSLLLINDNECELNNLCVLPDHRLSGIGTELLEYAFKTAVNLGCKKMNIGIVEENIKLRNWYEKNGFNHLGTQKFDFFPFTCGYMVKILKEI